MYLMCEYKNYICEKPVLPIIRFLSVDYTKSYFLLWSSIDDLYSDLPYHLLYNVYFLLLLCRFALFLAITMGCVTYVTGDASNHPQPRTALPGDAVLRRGCGRTDFQVHIPYSTSLAAAFQEFM